MATSIIKPRSTGPGGPQRSCGRGHGAGPDQFVPNCVVNTLSSNRFDAGVTLTIGLQDYAWEGWVMPFGPGPDSRMHIGLMYTGASANGLHFDMNDAGVGPYVYSSFVMVGTYSVTGAKVAVTPGWHHYAVNYDRSNLATVYIDGTSVDTVDISAWVAQNNNQAWYVSLGAGSTDTTPMAIGPMAFHLNTLLTTAQLADSLVNRYVQSSAATYGLWDPRYVVGPTGWDSDPTHFADRLYMQGIAADQQIPIPFAAPEGANGTVVLPDLSGNGRDLDMVTAAAYTTASQAYVTFGTDPFWEKT